MFIKILLNIFIYTILFIVFFNNRSIDARCNDPRSKKGAIFHNKEHKKCYMILKPLDIHIIRKYILNENSSNTNQKLHRVYGRNHSLQICQQIGKLSSLKQQLQTDKDYNQREDTYYSWEQFYGNGSDVTAGLPNMTLATHARWLVNTTTNWTGGDFHFYLGIPFASAFDIKDPRNGFMPPDVNLGTTVYSMDMECAYFSYQKSAPRQDGIYGVKCDNQYRDDSKTPNEQYQHVVCEFAEPADCVYDEHDVCRIEGGPNGIRCMYRKIRRTHKAPHRLGHPCLEHESLEDYTCDQAPLADDRRNELLQQCRINCQWNDWYMDQWCDECGQEITLHRTKKRQAIVAFHGRCPGVAAMPGKCPVGCGKEPMKMPLPVWFLSVGLVAVFGMTAKSGVPM